MNWHVFIPSSMATVGSACLALALVMVLIDLPGGAPWSKIAGWLAAVGGFGAIGGAGGWIGGEILSGQQHAVSFLRYYGEHLVGGGIMVGVIFGAVLWAWGHLRSKGIEAGGKGTWMKKARSLLKASIFGLIGALIATAIPPLYTGADWLVSHGHDLIV